MARHLQTQLVRAISQCSTACAEEFGSASRAALTAIPTDSFHLSIGGGSQSDLAHGHRRLGKVMTLGRLLASSTIEPTPERLISRCSRRLT